MYGWPLPVLEATMIRTASQRVALVAAADALFATDADAAEYRDALETEIFPGVDVVLYATDAAGGVRLDGAAETVASLSGVDLATLRSHRYDLSRPT